MPAVRAPVYAGSHTQLPLIYPALPVGIKTAIKLSNVLWTPISKPIRPVNLRDPLAEGELEAAS